MTTIIPIDQWKCSNKFLAFAIGLIVLFVWSDLSSAEPRTGAIYNQCACLCDGPTGGGIIDISNSGGFSCGAYNNHTCNYEDPNTGGIRTGTTKYCGGFKPGGTRASMVPRAGISGSVLRRGIESEQSAEPEMEITTPSDDTQSGEVQERAVPRMPMIGGTSGTITRPHRPSGPVAATTDVSCGDGKNYSISTGTKSGNCQVVRDGGRVIGGYCGDTKGNGSSVFCGIGCTGATKAGSCSAKAQ